MDAGLERRCIGDQLQAANIISRDGQFLYREGDHYVFMNSDTFEQYRWTRTY